MLIVLTGVIRVYGLALKSNRCQSREEAGPGEPTAARRATRNRLTGLLGFGR